MGLTEGEEGWVKKQVEVSPLDSFAGEFGEVAMLKIDVEGSEIDVLSGAKEVLKKTAEVRMETHSKELHEDSIRLLEQEGFPAWKSSFKGEIGYVFARRKA